MSFDLQKIADQSKQDAELDKITKEEFNYIPPIRLCQHQSSDVKTENKRARSAKEPPKFGAGSFCIEESYYDSVDVIPLAWRPCATEFEGDNFVRAVFDKDSDEFKEIAKKAKDRVEGFRSGVEFLFFSKTHGFLTMFYYGSFIRKNGVKKVNELMGHPSRLYSEEVSSNGYEWHVPKIAPGDYVFGDDDKPSDELYKKAMELFNDRSKKTPQTQKAGDKGEEVNEEEVGSKKKRKR